MKDLWLLFTSDYDDPDTIEKINREFFERDGISRNFKRS